MINQGVIDADVAGNTLRVMPDLSENTGVLKATAGLLELPDLPTNEGLLNARAGGRISIGGGSTRLNRGAPMHGNRLFDLPEESLRRSIR